MRWMKPEHQHPSKTWRTPPAKPGTHMLICFYITSQIRYYSTLSINEGFFLNEPSRRPPTWRVNRSMFQAPQRLGQPLGALPALDGH